MDQVLQIALESPLTALNEDVTAQTIAPPLTANTGDSPAAHQSDLTSIFRTPASAGAFFAASCWAAHPFACISASLHCTLEHEGSRAIHGCGYRSCALPRSHSA
jgi:hypothetical protein